MSCPEIQRLHNSQVSGAFKQKSYMLHVTCMCRPAHDVAEAGKFLVDNNFTYFFDINATGETAKWLRSAVLFYELSLIHI